MNIYSASFLAVFLQLFLSIIVLAAKKPETCFDILDKLPKNELKKIYFMEFNEIAHTHPATDVISCFLHATHPLDMSITEQYFNVYKKCDYIKAANFKPFGKRQIEELVVMGLPHNLEMDLRERMQTGSRNELQKGIMAIQVDMGKQIELSSEFKSYRKILLNKHNQRGKQLK